ncbi:hypothetical protein [Deferribacter abyssi]|uniref:hypothetical protein n=1 Tax=Deferribacter abyssi TaxID=213806 RepID=UPI003C1BD8E0
MNKAKKLYDHPMLKQIEEIVEEKVKKYYIKSKNGDNTMANSGEYFEKYIDTRFKHIEDDISEIKSDIKEIKSEFKEIKSEFKDLKKFNIVMFATLVSLIFAGFALVIGVMTYHMNSISTILQAIIK